MKGKKVQFVQNCVRRPKILLLFLPILHFPIAFTGEAQQMAVFSKTEFCRALSKCRQHAQHEFGQCAGGTLPAMAAKQGMLVDGSELRSGWKCFIGKLQKKTVNWLEEMNRTLGNSMYALYDRLEMKALKCAESYSASTRKVLNEEQLLRCKAIHLEMLVNSSSPFALLSLRGHQFEDPSGPLECMQIYEAELRRCEHLNGCCPELDMFVAVNHFRKKYHRCLKSIEAEIEMRSKETRVLKLLDKCMNEIPLKSAEVIFVRNGSTIESDVNQNEWITTTMPDPIPVPIIASPTSTFSPTSTDEAAVFQPSSTLLPPPDPTVRDLLDMLFPGLAIKGEKRHKEALEKKPRQEAKNFVDFALDKAETMPRGLVDLVVERVKQKLKNSGINKKPMERIQPLPLQLGETLVKEAAASNNAHSEAFVLESSNSIVEEDAEAKQVQSTTQLPPTTLAVTNVHVPNPPMNSSTHQLVAFTVGRIFCNRYMECHEVWSNLSADCVKGENETDAMANTDSDKMPFPRDWFSNDQLEKCLETRPLKLLASVFKQSDFCSIEAEFKRGCRLLHECCPSIV